MKYTCNVQYLAFFDIIAVLRKVVKNLSKGQMNDMFRQMEELFSKVDKLTLEVQIQKKQHDKEINKLKKEQRKEIVNSNFKIYKNSPKLSR